MASRSACQPSSRLLRPAPGRAACVAGPTAAPLRYAPYISREGPYCLPREHAPIDDSTTTYNVVRVVPCESVPSERVRGPLTSACKGIDALPSTPVLDR